MLGHQSEGFLRKDYYSSWAHELPGVCSWTMDSRRRRRRQLDANRCRGDQTRSRMYRSEWGLGTVVIEVPGHVNGSGLSALGLVRGRVPSRVFTLFFTCFLKMTTNTTCFYSVFYTFFENDQKNKKRNKNETSLRKSQKSMKWFKICFN